jgi:hypothetical protein
MTNTTLIVLFFGLVSCIQQNSETNGRTECYSKIVGIISPNLEYQGRGRLSEGDAKLVNHYRFNYDTKGRISTIEYFENNLPNDNSYYGTHQVVYTFLEDQLIRSYFNADGKKTALYRHYYLGDNIHKEKFQLDNFQNKTSMILMDSMDNQIESGIGSYRFEFTKIDDKNFIQQQFKKDGSPNVLTPYFPFNQAQIKTGKNNYLHTITNVDSVGNPTLNGQAGYAKIIFDFDDYGNELGWSFHDTSGSLSNRKDCFDMDYGFAKVAYEFNWVNQKLGLHNGFQEMYFDDDKKPVENNKGIHSIRYEYDENGNFSRTIKYNLEGREVK